MGWWMRKEPRGESVSDFDKAIIDNILCSKQKVFPSNVVDWGCLLSQSCWEEHQDSKCSVSFTALQMTFSHDAKSQSLLTSILVPRNFPGGSAGKESACNVGDLGLIPGLGRFPWRRERLLTLVFWPGEFHGLYSPWSHKKSDMAEWLSLSLISILVPRNSM